jgi:hypothetical protein
LVFKALDPDWIRIRIGIQPKTLDLDEMNLIRNPGCISDGICVVMPDSDKICKNL